MGLNDELSCFIDISAALSRSALNAANYDFREKESVYVGPIALIKPVRNWFLII